MWVERPDCVGIVPKNSPVEDAGLLLQQGDVTIGVIADGVGGRANGDKASMFAVAAVRDSLETNSREPMRVLFHRANEAIAQHLHLYADMATTLTVVHVMNDRFEIGHVGDCRAYHLRGGGLNTLTVDQNEGQYLVSQGVLNKTQVASYPRRNVLTSAMIGDSEYQLQIVSGIFHKADRILLMSDGAYNVISKREVADLNVASPKASDLVDRVCKVLTSRGVKDDATVVCVGR